MKALHCRVCNSLHSLKDSGEPTTCDCGRVTAWYTNADNGLACITAEDHDVAHLLSINNAWINDGPDLIPTAYLDMTTQKQIPYTQEQLDSFWRELHAQGTIMPRAPEHIRVWDQSRRGCPVAILTPGQSVDAQWG